MPPSCQCSQRNISPGKTPTALLPDALSGLALILLALTAVAMIFMPALVWATAGGFGGTERFDLAVGFGRIMFPYIFFISLWRRCFLVS